ncbi:MAG: UPF0158 family protein [Planctomycetota bacterium]
MDANEIIMALESSGTGFDWYLDLSSGEVVPIVDDLLDEVSLEALDAQPDRFFPIEPMESYEAFNIMEAFVAGLPPGAPSTRLAAALGQRRPFRNFKDALLEWPEIREQWFRFHDACMREVAEAWIAEHDLSVQLSPRPDSEPEA